MHTLSNGQLSAAVKLFGAELCSLRAIDGTELLWQPDPAVWVQQSPILFPIIGTLAGEQYELDGRFYKMSWHGFAMGMNFELRSRSEDRLLFGLKANEQTRTVYPFEFELLVSYQLVDRSLRVGFEVKSHGTDPMLFSIGGHPGFVLPDEPSACFLEFEREESRECRQLDKGGLLGGRSARVPWQGRLLPFDELTFEQGVWIFPNVKSDSVSLCSRRNSRRITVAFADFPNLGIWSRPGAPFVCIEPWHGIPEPTAPYGSLRCKPGMLTVAPGKSFSCGYSISC
jgi:galactose mutarotase-like enzyme